ncbi:MAG: DUF2283 domain-containing protein [Thermoleophilaceae bacterium]
MRISYDRDAGILYIALSDAPATRSDERPWGLVDIGPAGEVVGVEYWAAGKQLPADLLEVLPTTPLNVTPGLAR